MALLKLIILTLALGLIHSHALAKGKHHYSLLNNDEIENSFEITLSSANGQKSVDDEYIVFNIPLPPIYIFNSDEISIYSSKTRKLHFYSEALAHWKTIDNTITPSIRSLKIYLKNDSSHSFPLTLKASKANNSSFMITNKPNISDQIVSENLEPIDSVLVNLFEFYNFEKER